MPIRSILLAALMALTCLGCGSQLSTAIGVANALGTVASSAGERVNADFAKADHACLWRPNGTPSTSTLTEQADCLSRVRASYAGPLKAYDDFLATWTAFSFAVRAAETAEILGRTGDLSKIAALLPEVLRTADAFTVAYTVLVAPSVDVTALPAHVKAVP